uniref:YD repeat-containing protein n=1 Tax=Haemonchus contortus TaxID=6289 RepID=A0A7I4YIG6_HAECO
MLRTTVTLLLLVPTMRAQAQMNGIDYFNSLFPRFTMAPPRLDFNLIPSVGPDSNLIPPSPYRGVALNPNWGADLTKQLEEAWNSLRNAGVEMNDIVSLGGWGVLVDTGNGVTSVRSTIGDIPYTAQFPRGSSIHTSKNQYVQNGHQIEVFTITVDGVPYTYTTVDGHTTATDAQGRILTDGGPFKVPYP